ncbi:hypothetical protein RJT34_19562 [Clitoria ternatea]|uniref:Transcription repressor n=1 Tax=Clitoria ternatea TaxID=43366 RepID=A0AAN9P4T4_CLITE
MAKKMKLPSLLNKPSSSSSWPWPSCHQPRTLSFRTNNNDTTFKTINAAFLDATFESSESFFTDDVSPADDDSASFSTASEEHSRTLDSIETVIRGLRSDRLFFEPEETSSILEANKSPTTSTTSSATLPIFKDSVVLSLESQDPYVDFRKSMEEMVAAQCVQDWEGLQELLCWYLRVNGKTNHAYILGAFVDLLVAFSSSSSNNNFVSSDSPSSPLSFYSSSSCSTRCVSCLEAEDEVDITTTTTSTTTPTSTSFLLERVREDDDASSSI